MKMISFNRISGTASRILEKYATVYRTFFMIATLTVALLTGGSTERIAPFAVFYVLFLCLGLSLLRNAVILTLPFLNLTLLLIFCYDSYAVFIRYLWLLPIVLFSFAVHLFRLRPKTLRIGPTFFPLIAVALATLLGGIGTITPQEYFRPASLCFLLGLGPCLPMTYWIVKNEIRDSHDIRSLLSDLRFFGMTAALFIFAFLCRNPALFNDANPLSKVQWSNNIATMLMISMPAFFFSARRQPMLLSGGFVIFAALFLGGSRGGQLFAGIELAVCLFCLWRAQTRKPERIVTLCLFMLSLMGAAAVVLAVLSNPQRFGFFQKKEVRWSLICRSITDFRNNPLFGSGIGYLGNADLYPGKRGTILWYHVFPAQVIGSMGLCGVLAWGYLLFARFRVALSLWKREALALPLCYFGLLLMSMVNPGEFCPLPYAFLAVYLFAAAENAAAHTFSKKRGTVHKAQPPQNTGTAISR